MPKPTLDQQVSLPDPLSVVDYRLTFANIPGSPGIDMERVALDCTQALIPGITINKLEQRFAGGHRLNYGITSTFAGQMGVQFIERADAYTMKWLRPWHEYVRGTQTGNAGGYKADYSTVARLEVFDGPGRVAMEITIDGVFPQEIPELQLDSSSEAQGALYMVSFSFDTWRITGQRLG